MLCEKAVQRGKAGLATIQLVSEQHQGLAAVILAKCSGCGHHFRINSSPKIQTNASHQRYDINVRGVWGTMATGGGRSSSE
jgi:hypothetical protein